MRTTPALIYGAPYLLELIDPPLRRTRACMKPPHASCWDREEADLSRGVSCLHGFEAPHISSCSFSAPLNPSLSTRDTPRAGISRGEEDRGLDKEGKRAGKHEEGAMQ
eukprot:754964-Hanusia_phi.AAC.5